MGPCLIEFDSTESAKEGQFTYAGIVVYLMLWNLASNPLWCNTTLVPKRGIPGFLGRVTSSSSFRVEPRYTSARSSPGRKLGLLADGLEMSISASPGKDSSLSSLEIDHLVSRRFVQGTLDVFLCLGKPFCFVLHPCLVDRVPLI